METQPKYIPKGFLWTAYGMDHQPLTGYATLFAMNQAEAMRIFQHEYGNDSTILYLVADTFDSELKSLLGGI